MYIKGNADAATQRVRVWVISEVAQNIWCENECVWVSSRCLCVWDRHELWRRAEQWQEALMTQPSLEQQLSKRGRKRGWGTATNNMHLNRHTRNHKRTKKSNVRRGELGNSQSDMSWIVILALGNYWFDSHYNIIRKIFQQRLLNAWQREPCHIR